VTLATRRLCAGGAPPNKRMPARHGHTRRAIVVFALVTGACDAHTRVRGRVLGHDDLAPPTASLVLRGWTDHEVPIAPDGTFEASAIHGGKAWLRITADGVKATTRKLGPGVYDCVVRLVDTSDTAKEPWRVDCVKRKAH
jgi:hypothetical protein